MNLKKTRLNIFLIKLHKLLYEDRLCEIVEAETECNDIILPCMSK